LSRGEDEDLLIHEIRDLAKKIGGLIALEDSHLRLDQQSDAGDHGQWHQAVAASHSGSYS
jgi:hypothetical protein